MSEKTVVSRTKTVGELQEKIEVASRKTSALDRIWMSSLWLGVGALVHAWLAIQLAMVGLVVVLIIAGVATIYWAAKALAEYVRGRQL